MDLDGDVDIDHGVGLASRDGLQRVFSAASGGKSSELAGPAELPPRSGRSAAASRWDSPVLRS